MLKYAGYYDSEEFSKRGSKFRNKGQDTPTVGEVNEVIGPMTADTVLQILHGQGIFWGWNLPSDKHEPAVNHERKPNTRKVKAEELQKELRGQLPIDNYAGYSDEVQQKKKAGVREYGRKYREKKRIENQEKQQKVPHERKLYNQMSKTERWMVQRVAQARRMTIEQAVKFYLLTIVLGGASKI